MSNNRLSNPFSASRMDRLRYRPEGWTWDEMLTRIEQHHFRGAIVGPKGSGKSTLIRALIPKLAARGFRARFLRTWAERPTLSQKVRHHLSLTLQSRDIVILDGAEQLGWFAWRRLQRLFRPAAGFLITTHAPGRLPTLVTCRPSLKMAQTLLNELAGTESLPDETLRDAYERHGGNLREMIREFYDRYDGEAGHEPQ